MDSMAEKKKALMTRLDVEVWHKILGNTSDSKLSKVKFFRKFCDQFKQ